MAIYHFSVKIISRSQGRSATAAAAYRAAEKIKDLRTGETHDYTKKSGVNAKFILAPPHSPAWVQNREQLWNEIERVERRRDSQLAREINIALPIELDKTQQVELVSQFVNEQFVSQGAVADVAFHHLNGNNPHAHIMLTMREMNSDRFSAKKNREWDRVSQLQSQRKAWADSANLALERAGQEQRIDHRSNEAQGIERIPQIHLGANVSAMMKRGIVTERGERYKEIAIANEQLLTLDREITSIYKEEKNSAYAQSVASSDLAAKLPVGQGDKEKERAEELTPQEIDNVPNSSVSSSTNIDTSHKENPNSSTADNEPQLTDLELVAAIRQVRAWQDKKPLYPDLKLAASLNKTIEQNQLKLNKLNRLITQQQQELQQAKPQSLFNPWGMSRADREARENNLNRLEREKDSITWDNRNTAQRFKSCQRTAQTYLAWRDRPERELANLIESDAYFSRVETLESGYQIYGAVLSIINNRGIRSEDNPQLSYYQGKTYRFEQRDKTISIFEKDKPEPIYTAIDNREAGGIIEIERMKLEREIRQQIMAFARHLEAERQKQQRQKQRGRGFSLG